MSLRSGSEACPVTQSQISRLIEVRVLYLRSVNNQRHQAELIFMIKDSSADEAA